MRKTLFIGIVGFIIIIIGSISIQIFLQKSSDFLVADIDHMQVLAESKQKEELIKLKNDFTRKWEITHKIWAALIDHNEIDNIEEIVRRAEVLIENTEDNSELLAELNRLKFYMEHIPQKERLAIENLL